MKNKKTNIIFLYFILVLAILLVTTDVTAGETSPEKVREYQIKAAFIYNFIQFIDWPSDENTDSNNPIRIGVIGKNPFGDALDALSDKKIQNRIIKIEYFSEFENVTDKNLLKNCQVLFICNSENENAAQIINTVKNDSILTIAEIPGFLEMGGIIRFITEEEKIRFEINITAAERAKLTIRSKLLRLAKNVYKEEEPSKHANSSNNGTGNLVSISAGIKE